MSSAHIEILDGGALTSVQDAVGRAGWRHLGVPACGAADPWSARLANRLVGNDDTAPLLEMTLSGPRLRFASAALLGLAGADLSPSVDGVPAPMYAGFRVRGGATLAFGACRGGARAYLAVGGGLRVSPVLGSPATDLRAGFGGHEGRALRAGDHLELGAPTGSGPMRWSPAPGPPPAAIRVTAGPHSDRFASDALERLCAAAWVVSPAADRAGVRLDGPTLEHRTPDDAEVPSLGVPPGAVQVPPDGRPILMLADRPVTGGYPFLACVARADLGRVAQLVPGDEVAFRTVTRDGAIGALLERERLLERLEPTGDGSADASGWAGWPG